MLNVDQTLQKNYSKISKLIQM